MKHGVCIYRTGQTGKEPFMIKITIHVDGMMCGMCESHVNDAIRKELSVKKVTSSHTKKQTVILAEDDIDDGTLAAVIGSTGYTFVSADREPYKKRGLFRI